MFSENSFIGEFSLGFFARLLAGSDGAAWGYVILGESGERSSRGAHDRSAFCWVGCGVLEGVGCGLWLIPAGLNETGPHSGIGRLGVMNPRETCFSQFFSTGKILCVELRAYDDSRYIRPATRSRDHLRQFKRLPAVCGLEGCD
jgi:hypothetical protein